jgi:hypothetical protein
MVDKWLTKFHFTFLSKFLPLTLISMKPRQHLIDLYLAENKRKYPKTPDFARTTPIIKLTTANGLTKAVVDFINLSGHFASRINNQGTWVREKAHINGGFYRPSTQVRGIADITATINGKTVFIEIKVGKDRQSIPQKAFQEKIERSGGQYWLVSTFDQFFEKYNNFVK